MNWIRHQATRGSGRSTLLLSSVLALLALACFPILAQADSGTIEYDPSLPSDGGAKQNENIAKSSESPNSGGAEAPPSAGSSESYPEEAPPSSESESTANTGNDGGKGQGSPDKGNNPPAATKVQPSAPIAKSTPDSSDDGGSSPLLPILVAVLVLAAISVAAIVIRQRRQRDGSSSSLSTKAG
jgi:cobalamin biosynthesis Mg chelatase CobN